jgi:phospholipid/cholesterol/gamma-HCH transport system substrate-binding protein
MRSVVRIRDVVSFAVFAIMIVSVLGYFGTLGLRVSPPRERTNLSMEVPEINGIVAGSNVLLRGVAIGKVSSTNATVRAGIIDFYIDGGYRIPVDSEIRLENLSALGESYIGLIPRGDDGPMLQDGQRIAAKAVTQPPSISELATSVVRVLDQLDPPALERVISEANAALPDPAAVLPNISRASTLLRNTVRNIHGSGRAVLDNFQILLKDAEYVAPALKIIGPNARIAGVGIQDLLKGLPLITHRGEPENLTEFNKLFKRIQSFLDDRGPDLKVLGEAFLPKLNAIAGALMNFDTGQILDRMLAAVPPDGTVTLRVIP